MIQLLSPVWLLLFVPLAAAMWAWRLPSRLLIALRALALVLLLLALAGFAVKLPSRAGTVVVVADRSKSMPGESASHHLEAVRLLESSMAATDRLAVIGFAESSMVEHAPQRGQFGGFSAQLSGDGSNLGAALDQAMSLIGSDSPGRIVVLSDGRWTGSDPMSMAARAAGRNIAIDFRGQQRPTAADLAIASIEAPGSVYPREAFMITGWVSAPVAQEVNYELRRGNTRIAAGSRAVPSGLTRLTFRDVIDEPGAAAYTLLVHAASADTAADPVPENNTARALVGVEGPRPILYLTEKTNATFAALLRRGGLNIRTARAENTGFALEELANYSAVVIEEVPAGKIGHVAMQNMAEWVRQTGAGIMLTGGQTSFGPGGYFQSPLDPVLPVSMELRKEHRKFRVAIVVVLDRSGSMAAPVPGGKRKMDLADLAAAQVVDMLTPMDELGVIAEDSSAHVIASLQRVESPADLRDRILRIESMGGGIFVYDGLVNAARMIQASNAGTRHIILFADAADAEEPGKYQELLAETTAAGITVSVIGLGTEHDSDAAFLKDVAKRGGGRIFFTDVPEELPRLFAQDTFVVARSSFIDEPTATEPTASLTTITGRALDGLPGVGGYNLTYLRDGATMGVVTTDEYKAPIVAAWNAGSGRALAYTGQADGKFTGALATWPGAGDYLTSLVRWTAGQQKDLPDHMMLTQQVREGVAHVTLHLDPHRTTDPLKGLPTAAILRGLPGRAPTSNRATMQWVSPDELEVAVALQGTETVITTVDLPGLNVPAVSMAPVTLPYSPEFKPSGDERGVVTLQQLAKATGGVERIDLAGTWADLPHQPRMIPLAPWLLGAAVLVFLLEILERRTGAVSMVKLPKRKRAVAKPTAVTEPSAPSTPVATTKTLPRPAASAAPPVAVDAPAPDLNDALSQARRRAQQRTDRK